MEEIVLDDSNADEFFEHYKITADPGQSPFRVDKFLTDRIENATRNKVQNAAKGGFILVNGIAVKPNYKVKAGDVVALVLPHPPRNKEIIPQDIPMDIIYEDDYLLIVNKLPGMVVHPGYGNYDGTLVNALAYHFDKLPQLSSNVHDNPRPGLVHRIDKETSGLLVIAKDESCMTHLANQFFHHTINRTYLAFVWGDVKEESGTIDSYLMRSPRDRKITISTNDPDKGGKRAITHYKVLERFGFATFIQCKLETGRTHQIRVHMKSIGHTLFADSTYGGDKILAGGSFNRFKSFIDNTFKILPRQALHATELGFVHPITKKEMNFIQELPKDMSETLERFRSFFESYAKL